MSETLKVIRTNKEVEEMMRYLESQNVVAFDTETTGLGADADIIGYSVCAEDSLAYYVVTAYWDVERKNLQYLETTQSARKVMKILATKQLLMHNAIFDCSQVWNNYRIQLKDALLADTMIMAHLLDENRRVGLKDLAANAFGADAKKEQSEMKESVEANGGSLTKDKYELYKADSELIGKYGAKDTILTWRIFHTMVPELFEEGMDDFFFNDESMPLLKGPTYDMNTTGLKVDEPKLKELHQSLVTEIVELQGAIYHEIGPHIVDVKTQLKTKEFNLNSNTHLAWLLFHKLGNTFPKLSKLGQEFCLSMNMRLPYNNDQKLEFISAAKTLKGSEWRKAGEVLDNRTKKPKGKAVVRDYWAYIATDRAVLESFSEKYVWVQKLLEYKYAAKLLSTYVMGIEGKVKYGVIHPQFLQHGTTSGRYSSRTPNFQNLPRDDKRIKDCIMARPGKVFIGADFSQLEPRVFAFYSGDIELQKCFSSGLDFYSVLAAKIFNKTDASMVKNDSDPNFFGNKYKRLRHIAKTMALSVTYGTTARKLAVALNMDVNEAQNAINDYFLVYPSVKEMMVKFHDQVKDRGYVESHFGRRRRIPAGQEIVSLYGNLEHGELPYQARNLLNLAVNHPIQSTGASIVNRAAIAFKKACPDAPIVLQIHDEIVCECDEAFAKIFANELKNAMEKSVTLPGVSLIAEPKIGRTLAELK